MTVSSPPRRSDWDDIFAEIEVEAADAKNDAPAAPRVELLLMGATGWACSGTARSFGLLRLVTYQLDVLLQPHRAANVCRM